MVIGLVPNRDSCDGFSWTDGSCVEDGYSNWDVDEPTQIDNQKCVVIVNNEGKWKDDGCASPKHYACQRSSGKCFS